MPQSPVSSPAAGGWATPFFAFLRFFRLMWFGLRPESLARSAAISAVVEGSQGVVRGRSSPSSDRARNALSHKDLLLSLCGSKKPLGGTDFAQ